MNPAVRLLAARSLRTHRRAWAAVFAAVAVTSALLGALALALGSTALGHARVERYTGAAVVVAGDHEVSRTTDPWGGEPQTATAGLTERVRIPEAAVGVVRAVPGVRAAVPDHTFVVRERAEEGERGGGERERVTDPEAGPRTHPGRSWAAAALAPYALTEGRAPRRDDEAVVGAGLGLGTGDRTGGYRVVGVAGGPAAVYVTEAEARKRAGRPGRVDAVGVLAAPGVPVDTLHARVRAALDTAGLKDTASGRPLRALTGDGRGDAEHLGARPARSELLELLAAVSGTVLLVSVLVLASLVAQALQQRAAERELLLAVGATPRQVRAAAGREVVRVAGAAALLGALGAVPAFLALWEAVRARPGAVAEGLALATPAWLFAAPLVTALLVTGLARLVVALGAGRPGRAAHGPGRVRRVAGFVLLVLGVGSAGTATLQSGEAAGAAAGAATVTLVSGCALLGPWIAGAAMRLLDRPFRLLGGAPGRLAAAGAVARSRRLGAALTPVVLVTAFALVQLTAGATAQRAAAAQAREATTANLAVSGTTAEEVRRRPGVTAATDVLRSTVVLARDEAGAPRLDRLPVLGVDPDGLEGVLDPGVVAGDLAGLAGPGTVAVGADRADSLDARPGSTVRLRLGDGVEKDLRVVAVYERSLALGEFLFPKAGLAPHTTDPHPARVLARTTGGPGRAVAPEQVALPGAASQAVVAAGVVGAIGALTLLSVLSTLALIGAGRRRELELLRQVGASAGQLRRMLGLEAGFLIAVGLLLGLVVAALPLTAFSWAHTGGLPYLPPVQAALIAGTVAATVTAGVFGAHRPGGRTG
ncbi:FtsX-like permease family protein [Streptomyces sp. NPDC085466]|uniref:FtsX-like permease family protein n=1 Tax=Streptomyces sp. NPDC085466 TaxID=3365725 RepID=UPI0037D6B0C3